MFDEMGGGLRHASRATARGRTPDGRPARDLSTDDDVERAGVRCLVDVCSIAFSRFVRADKFTVESWSWSCSASGGANLVVERESGQLTDVHVYGGWLDHSFFATQSVLLKSAEYPDQGATVVYAYSVGLSSGENPSAVDGSARWEGLMLGRDIRASPSRGQVVRGNADVTVEFGASAITADVEFTGIANTETGDRQGDMAWHGMAVEGGGFAQRNAADDTISGRFFGPDSEEVGGVFERDGIAGAIRRTALPPSRAPVKAGVCLARGTLFWQRGA